MKTTIQIVLVVVATAFTLNAMSQTGIEHQQYNEDMSFEKQFMTKYERELVSFYNGMVQQEASKMKRKAIKNGIAGLFFPVFYIPASVQVFRYVKCREELESRQRYYSNLNL